MKTIHHVTNSSDAGSLRRAMTHAGTALIESRTLSSVSNLAFSLALLVLFSLAWRAQAQTPCPGSDTCPGKVAQMVCPDPGTTLPGNDVTFTWCNANADYFLQIESIRGAHDIFYALVSFQNFVHLINLPTNGQTIYVTLWTQVKGTWQTPLDYTYTAANLVPPRLGAARFGTNGQFQFTISGVTPGKTNVVQSSLNLSDWTSIATNVAVSNSLQIVDSTATNSSRRFYRMFEIH
jgi:hypothetical protein